MWIKSPFLFAGTLFDNVSLDQNLSSSQVWQALEWAGFEEDVRAFPRQLETPLGEWGINLSGGQKQRLALARLLARRPQVLLLDDTLSAVDTVTEERILTHLHKDFSSLTIVWVAHRVSTLKHCQRLLEMT